MGVTSSGMEVECREGRPRRSTIQPITLVRPSTRHEHIDATVHPTLNTLHIVQTACTTGVSVAVWARICKLDAWMAL